MNIDEISFGAIPINKINIKKFNKSSAKYADYPVNFVKIDVNNPKDLEAVSRIEKKWKGAKYIQKIVTDAHWLQGKPRDVYALTSQQNNFDKLQPENILGLAEMRTHETEQNLNELYYLQVRPGAMNVNQKHKITYKYAGSSILKSLKKIYNSICLTADNDKNVIDFYKKNGFLDYYTGSRHFVWSRNIFKMAKMRLEKFMLEIGI